MSLTAKGLEGFGLIDEGSAASPSPAEPTIPRNDGAADEPPLYVNAKQFHRILKRRVARQKLEEQLHLTSKGRKAYVHESRHNHALRRPRGPGGRFLTADEVAAMEAKAFIRQEYKKRTARRKRKMELPMLIRGSIIPACADSGSEDNIMAVDTATQLGLHIQRDVQYVKEFRLANSKVVTSVGQVLADCAFAKDPSSVWQCCFYIFERLIAPLIMGMAFLDETETMTKHKYRLQEQIPFIPPPLKVNTLGFPKRRVLCYMDTKKIYANADTGSELELMSRAYARRRGYGVQLIPKDHSDEVQFADGSTTKLVGQVEADITFGSLKGDKYKQTFYVLEDLQYDILLGEDFLDELDAFATYRSSFVLDRTANDATELSAIVWLSRPEQRIFQITHAFGRKSDTTAQQESPLEHLNLEVTSDKPQSTYARVESFLKHRFSSTRISSKRPHGK
jgi:hypothetical protein